MNDLRARLEASLAGRYRFLRELGRGGMATVFLVQELKHDRPVALKVLHPELATSLGAERFQREIRHAARLQHPHILTVHDSGEEDGLLWFTMPPVEGESLRARLTRETQLPVDLAVRIVREAAQALAYAHQQGIIHRDIKPENLLLTTDGNTLVADFGIAQQTTAGATRLTETGYAVGTPAYMSPEQASAERNLDGRTDVYSLAVVLYELLTGEPPFDGPTAHAILAKRLSGPVPSVRVVRPSVPAYLDRALARALAALPADRFGSMAEFADALDPASGGADRASPRRMTPTLLAVGAVLLALGLLWWRLVSRGDAADHARVTSAAVLPFADQSPGGAEEYFSDGLTEELTTALARIPGLRVVARSSAFQFKGSTADVREIGRRLGVGAVLEGSVRRNGGRLHVSAQLVNTGDGFELWSESYDRDMADVFQVQEEIARAIGGALRVRLGASSDSALRRRPTTDLVAHDLYLKGRFAWNQRTATSLVEAARYFGQAVARDTSFVQAWAGLADANVLLPIYSGTAPAEAWPRARAAALRAIALDSNSAEAHTSLAYGTMLYQWDWAASEREFLRAIAADSTYPTAHHWYADFLAGRDRPRESSAELLRAQELDPLSRIIGTELGWSYMWLDRFDLADSAISRVIRLDPNYAQAYFNLAQLRIEQRRYPEAIAAMRQSFRLGGRFPHGTATLIAAYARSGDRSSATALLDSLIAEGKRSYVPPFAFAIAYANLGDMDRAFAALDRGIRERDVLLPENFFELLLDPLKPDPRYPAVAAVIRGGP